jgi:AraC-like DNA-binding protein
MEARTGARTSRPCSRRWGCDETSDISISCVGATLWRVNSEVRNDLFLLPECGLFLGPVIDNESHRHHAVQIVVAPDPFVVRFSGLDEPVRSRAIVIASDVEHQLIGESPRQNVVLLDRESAMAEFLSRELFAPGRRDHFVTDNPYDDASYEAVPDHRSWFPADRSSVEWSGLRGHIATLIRLSSGRSFPAHVEVARDSRIVSACELIAGARGSKLSLGEIAAHVGLSESRLTHLFKAVVGIPIRRYIMWQKLRRAIDVAAQEDRLFTDAAYEAGFADQAHFTRTFKEMLGFCPGDLMSRRAGVVVHVCPQ